MLDNLMPLAISSSEAMKPASGLYGLALGLVGGGVTIAQVAHGFDPSTVFGVMAGTAAAIGGFLWSAYCFPQNAAIKECDRLRIKIEAMEASYDAKLDAQDARHDAEIAALNASYHLKLTAGEDERTSLFRRAAALEGEISRLKARFNAATLTPDPDTGEFDTRPR